MKLSLREKLMVCLLVWAVGIYLFYNYAYTPAKNQAADWMGKNVLLREQLDAARQIDKDVKGMGDKQQRYKEKYMQLARQVPSAEYVPEAVAFVEDKAEESGLALVLFNYDKKTESDKSKAGDNAQSAVITGARSLNFNLTGQGSYYDAVTFLESMQEAARIYSITEVGLLAGQRKSEMPGEVTEGQATASLPDFKGASRFDPDDITLTLKFTAYCDGKMIPGIIDVENPVEPVTSKRDNPFVP